MRTTVARFTAVLFMVSAAVFAASCLTTPEPVPGSCADASACAPPTGGTSTSVPPSDAAGPSADATSPPDAAVARTERVFFVGNSYTYYNDLPAVVRAIGQASRTPFETSGTLVGGATLGQHWTSGAKETIANGKFDAVVIQGQSVEALGGEGGFETYAPYFGDAAKAAGGRAVYFATWARGPKESAYLRGEAVANRIEKAYSKAALATGAKVARVGGAFHQASVALPQVNLYQDDQSHPSAEGTLLAACTIVATLTGKAPRLPDPPPLGIPKGTAEALCTIGADVRCMEGGDVCGGFCYALQTDPRQCGRCGTTCAANEPCQAGRCGCAAGQTACALACTDVRYDSSNCGACGKRCEIGRSCQSGACACSGGAYKKVVAIPQLAALEPTCTELGQAACDVAGKRLCVAEGCATTSLGPPSGHAPNEQAVVCMPGLTATNVAYTALAALDSRCDGVTERHGEGCVTAVNRHCQSQGMAGGFGHYAATGADVAITCLPSSRALAITVDAPTLASQISRCEPNAVTCSAAAWNLCASFGFDAGFGPVESSGSMRTVMCVR